MIAANELRIGNKVNSIQGEIYVTAYGLMMLEEGLNEDWQPIPLTEQWLVDFGFEKKQICIMSNLARQWHESQRVGSSFDDCYELGEYFVVPRIGMKLNIKTLNNSIEIDSTTLGNNLRYVHSLQNLYFALTGTELTKNQ